MRNKGKNHVVIHHLNPGIMKRPGDHSRKEPPPTLQERQKAYKTQISEPLPQKQGSSTDTAARSLKAKTKKYYAANNHSKNHEDCFRRSRSYKRGDFEKAALNYVDN